MERQKVDRAGIIPYYINDDGSIKMMFMKPSDIRYGGDQFQIAKGKCEEGETTEQTALREGNEELGLFSGNVLRVKDLGVFLGRTTVFVCEVRNLEMFGDTCDETEETIWWSLNEFEEKGRPLHVPVVKAAARWIQRNM